LTRVRALTQDDCHVFCMQDQIGQEISLMLDMISEVYEIFGLTDFWVRISLHDPKNREKYIGTDEYWNTAEDALKQMVAEKGMKSEIGIGEAAFYGPKLDFMFKDAIGREWQLSTIQLDYNLPERFNCEYIASDGSKHRPIVIHRAILGSTERFLGIIIEHFAGAFPTWLSPVQVRVIPVGLTHLEPSEKLSSILKEKGVRVEVDLSNESVGKKIREAEKSKVPYMVVIGDKEARDLVTQSVDRFTTGIVEEVQKRLMFSVDNKAAS
jgi:threonyl-tRNA synthetase